MKVARRWLARLTVAAMASTAAGILGRHSRLGIWIRGASPS
jgi:hypothetical protein